MAFVTPTSPTRRKRRKRKTTAAPKADATWCFLKAIEIRELLEGIRDFVNNAMIEKADETFTTLKDLEEDVMATCGVDISEVVECVEDILSYEYPRGKDPKKIPIETLDRLAGKIESCYTKHLLEKYKIPIPSPD